MPAKPKIVHTIKAQRQIYEYNGPNNILNQLELVGGGGSNPSVGWLTELFEHAIEVEKMLDIPFYEVV